MRKPTLKRILASHKDRLYLDRPDDHTVRASNGHWLICLPAYEFDTPEFSGFLPENGGEGLSFQNGANDGGTCPKFENVIPSSAEVLEKVERTNDLKDASLSGSRKLYARKLNGGDVTTYVSESYLDMIEDAVNPDEWRTKGEECPVCAISNGSIVAVVMPIHVS